MHETGLVRDLVRRWNTLRGMPALSASAAPSFGSAR